MAGARFVEEVLSLELISEVVEIEKRAGKRKGVSSRYHKPSMRRKTGGVRRDGKYIRTKKRRT